MNANLANLFLDASTIVSKAWATKADTHAMGTEANSEGRGSAGREHVILKA